MRALLTLLLLSGCSLYLDPLYESYLAEGLMGLSLPIQDLAVPDGGGGVLVAADMRQVKVWDRSAAHQDWLLPPRAADLPIPRFVSLASNSLGVVDQEAEGDCTQFEVRVFDLTNRELEGTLKSEVGRKLCPRGFAFMGNNMTFYLAEADTSQSTPGHRLAEYHRIEGEATFALTKEQPLEFVPATLAACSARQWLATCGIGSSQGLSLFDFSNPNAVAAGTNAVLGDCDALAFSADCAHLAVHRRSSERVDILDTANPSGDAVAQLIVPKLGTGAKLAFSRDRVLLAVSATNDQGTSGDPSLTFLFDWKKGEQIFRVEDGHHLCGLAFEPEGRRLATGSQSGIVKLWDVEKILRDRE